MSKTLYVAGPMSGLPQFNFPLFDAVAESLRDDGYTIVSPHECDSEETRRMAWASPDGAPTGGGESWGVCLARDVKMLADGVDVRAPTPADDPVQAYETLTIDGIAFLPNWDRSKGARLEAFVGLLTGKEFYTVQFLRDDEADPKSGEFVLSGVTDEWVQHMLAAPWAEAIKMHTPLVTQQSVPSGTRDAGWVRSIRE